MSAWHPRTAICVSKCRERRASSSNPSGYTLAPCLHLLLLDMGLAGADALDVLRRIHQEAPTIGVIILTGNRELALARLGFELGATDCLFKPFDLDRLGQAVASSMGLVSR